MTGDAHRDVTPEVLAAFVAGRLRGKELKMTADHLRHCEDCRHVVAAAAFVDRQEPGVPERKPWPAPWWLTAAAAALLAGAVYIVLTRTRATESTRSIDPVRVLIAAAPRKERYIEPRLSGGFPWAPLRPVRRDAGAPLDSEQMKMIGAAGTVLEKTAGDPSVAAQHARAIAHLAAGRPKEAADLLQDLAARTSDPTAWCDLAAARYALFSQTDDPAQLAAGLAAADAALRLRPALPEALFNRALIIDRLGLREQARTAWGEYLARDPRSDWAREGREHLQRLAPRTEFRDELRLQYDRLAANPAAARELAMRFPQEARVWGESEILARWADAALAGRSEAANAHLRLARAFGETLARKSGEGMLLAAVAAAERATGAERTVLAQAHLRFRDAQRAYKQGRLADAGRMFDEAERGFRQAGSPVAMLARYFSANTAFDQGRIAESRQRLEQLLGACRPELSAYCAQVEWELGLAYATLGRWGESIHLLQASIALFDRLGESNYATAVREILSEVYDRIGDPETAWSHRLTALQVLGRSEDLRLQVALDSIAREAALDRRWPVCVSFLTLEADMARRGGNDLRLIETVLLRARAEAEMGRRDAAARDLALAAQATARLRDAALRERAEADHLAVAGYLAPSPARTVELLGKAIEFHRSRGRRIYLPEMLLHRGRALMALGRRRDAAADLEEGIAEMERQRMSLDSGDARWGVFVEGSELFDEAVTLAFDGGDQRLAFAYSERARARQLLESIGDGWKPAVPVTADAVLIEYASLPSRLVIFVVDGGRIHSAQETVTRAFLKDAADRLARSAERRDEDEFRRTAAALYKLLVAPVADTLPPGRTVAFIPDATLSAVPFAALIDDRGRYVVEQHAVVVTPSARVFQRLALRRAGPREQLQLLVIAGSSAAQEDGFASLAATQREARDVVAVYGRSAAVAPRGADLAWYRTAAASADVIHFVGHSSGAESGRDAALLASRVAGEAGRLQVRDIAAMRLRRARVVVLAACSSGRGPDFPGEGAISLARAFLGAGVPSVIATLWPIEDGAAADFFPRLHQRLAAGLPAAEALRSTQLECIQRRDTPLGMWAAVQVFGS